MKIKVDKLITEEVNISPRNELLITEAVLRRLVHPGEYIKKKYDPKVQQEDREDWLAQDDPNWRHGSVSTEYIRSATELDKAVFKVLEKLNEQHPN